MFLGERGTTLCTPTALRRANLREVPAGQDLEVLCRFSFSFPGLLRNPSGVSLWASKKLWHCTKKNRGEISLGDALDSNPPGRSSQANNPALPSLGEGCHTFLDKTWSWSSPQAAITRWYRASSYGCPKRTLVHSTALHFGCKVPGELACGPLGIEPPPGACPLG